MQIISAMTTSELDMTMYALYYSMLNIQHVIKALVQIIRNLLDLGFLNSKVLLNCVYSNIQSANVHFSIFGPNISICNLGLFSPKIFPLQLQDFVASVQLTLAHPQFQ